MLHRFLHRPAIYSQGLKFARTKNTVLSSSLGRKIISDAKTYPIGTKCRFSQRFAKIQSKSVVLATSNRRQMGVTTAAVHTGVDYTCMMEVTRAGQGMMDDMPKDNSATELLLVSAGEEMEEWKGGLSEKELLWLGANGFDGKEGEMLCMPSENGGIERVIFVIEDPYDIWAYSSLPTSLPSGTYFVKTLSDGSGSSLSTMDAISIGWILGTYSFNRYKSSKKLDGEDQPRRPCLVWPLTEKEDKDKILAITQGIFLARDMISTPAEHMAPQHIEEEARCLADCHNAVMDSIVGDDLLKQNYPAIHTVGRASTNAPRLIDIRWCPTAATKDYPKITLVGKGVSFDTGGLDLKPPNAMKLMKKDMGGAALVLGLAHAIMATNLPVQLRVLIPAVENSVSGNAFRPLDVLQTRAGITVENGNTDAEGRLILCDALAEATREKPDLILDAATLTGAARVALGTEMPALFCNNDEVADGIIRASNDVRDFMWRMPLHQPYRKMINSKVADIGSCSDGGYAGAITAALFLQEFVKDAPAWAHVDTMGYNVSTKPGRPEGGEAFALRALFEYISTNYASSDT